ncbi:MAG: MFS transporter [Opitutales bacterium]
MSVLVVVKKNGRAAIAADSLNTIGDLAVSAENKEQPEKLRRIPGGFVGLVGWSAFDNILDSVLVNYPDLFHFANAGELYRALMQLHQVMKEHYFVTPYEEGAQPVESSQLDGLIAHRSGIFGFTSYRHVLDFSRYWAKGSGRDYALGALHVLFDRYKNAGDIARAAVETACAYDVRCAAPVHVHTLKLQG